MSNEEIILKCMESYTRDVGRGVARIDYDSMDEIGASTGDVIVVGSANKKSSGLKCLPLYPSDEGKGIIRLDGLARENVGVAVGNEVNVVKIKANLAETVHIMPLEAIPPIDERYIADALESVPVRVGDKVAVPYFGGRLFFKVQWVKPDGVGLVTQKTVFKILEQEKKEEKEKNANEMLQKLDKKIQELYGSTVLSQADIKQPIFDDIVELNIPGFYIKINKNNKNNWEMVKSLVDQAMK